MRRILLVVFLIFAEALLAFGQTEADSLKQVIAQSEGSEQIDALNRLAALLLQDRPARAREYASQALELAQKEKYRKAVAQAWLHIGDSYFYEEKYDSATGFYEDALKLYRQINDPDGIATSLYYLAVNYDYNKDRALAAGYYLQAAQKYDSLHQVRTLSDIYYSLGMIYDTGGDNYKALDYYQKSLAITDSLDLPQESAATLNTIGTLFYDWGNFKEALSYYKKSLKIMRQGNNLEGIAQTLNNIGILYYDWGNLDEALKFYKESLQIEEQRGNEAGMSSSYNNIGIIYADQKKYDQALDYYNRSLEIERKHNDKSGIATSLNNLGELYSETGQPLRAIGMLEQSLTLEKEIGDALGIAIAFNTLSALHLKNGNINKSLRYNDSSLAIANRLSNPETIMDAYKNYTDAYEVMDKPGLALHYQKRYAALKDSLFSENMHKEIARLQASYELDKKQKEIELLNSRNRLHQLDLENKRIIVRRQRVIMYITIVGFVAVLIVSIILFRLMFQKRKAYALLNEQNREILRNRNELIRARDKAEESDRLKSIFLANMSHELRTPLNGILGFTEILRSEVKDPAHREMADVINTSGNRLLETLNSIIDLSIIESNKMELNAVQISLDDLINERVTLYKIAASKKNLYLNTDIPEKGIVFLSDAKILRNLLNNLIDNAIKYTRTGGIDVGAAIDYATDPPAMEFRVSDTGIGIPQEQVKFIFEKFRQVSEGHNREYEGAGLGLTICKKYLELLNGSLQVESRPGEGSTFIARFPVALARENMPRQDAKEKQKDNIRFRGKKPRVLVVENEETNLRYIEYNLKNFCQVDAAMDGPEAIRQVSEKQYDAILMDINLGATMNGMTAAQHIRQVPGYSSIPIAAVTANAMKGQKEEFLAGGCTHYLSKPFTTAQIRDLVKEMLNGRS